MLKITGDVQPTIEIKEEGRDNVNFKSRLYGQPTPGFPTLTPFMHYIWLDPPPHMYYGDN